MRCFAYCEKAGLVKRALTWPPPPRGLTDAEQERLMLEVCLAHVRTLLVALDAGSGGGSGLRVRCYPGGPRCASYGRRSDRVMRRERRCG